MGHVSVIFFFVLSGFALGIRFTKGTNCSYWRFQLSRIARLLPCVVIVIAVASILRLRTPNVPNGSLGGAFNDIWVSPLDFNILVRHALLVGVNSADTDLAPPMWSLVYEFRMGLLIPILMYFLRIYSVGFNIILMTGIYGLSAVALVMMGLPNPVFSGETKPGSLVATSHYLVSFYIGCVLYHWMHRPRQSASTSLAFVREKGVAVAAAGLWVAGTLTHSDLLLSLAAAGAIFCILRITSSSRLLEATPIQFLGKISYSLYLVHMPASVAILRLVEGNMSDAFFVMIATAASIVTATLLYLLVERPSIHAARMIGRTRKGTGAVDGHRDSDHQGRLTSPGTLLASQATACPRILN